MDAFSSVEGVAAALRRDNIDTDIIIPMEDLLSVPLHQLGEAAFRPLRFFGDGSENPDFILNKPVFRNATILIAGRNFGSGSSREGAVNAIDRMGIRVVIAPSFGDIFYGNCFKNGILPIRLSEVEVAHLMDMADSSMGRKAFVVDLSAQTITDPDGRAINFMIDEALKQRLLTGEDEISVTLRHEAAIAVFQERDRRRRPWVWETMERRT